MRLLPAIAMILALVTALGAQAPNPPLPSIALPPELERVLRDYERAWAAGDAAGGVPVH